MKTWDERPSDETIEAHVREFFAAVAAKQGATAFALCAHGDTSKPYVRAPDKKSIAAAMKLVAKVLTDSAVVDDAKTAHARLGVASVKVSGLDVYAKMTIDGAAVKPTGLFRLVQTEGRYLLTFSMLRIFPTDVFA